MSDRYFNWRIFFALRHSPEASVTIAICTISQLVFSSVIPRSRCWTRFSAVFWSPETSSTWMMIDTCPPIILQRAVLTFRISSSMHSEVGHYIRNDSTSEDVARGHASSRNEFITKWNPFRIINPAKWEAASSSDSSKLILKQLLSPWVPVHIGIDIEMWMWCGARLAQIIIRNRLWLRSRARTPSRDWAWRRYANCWQSKSRVTNHWWSG